MNMGSGSHRKGHNIMYKRNLTLTLRSRMDAKATVCLAKDLLAAQIQTRTFNIC
jgi:hypothetical protein